MPLKRNIIANYVGQGWTAIMGLAFIPLYIQYLGMESYGLIGLFAAMQAWLTLLDMGMTPTLNREMARFTAGVRDTQSMHDLLRSLETICVVLAVAVALAVWGASGYLAGDWLNAESLPVPVVAQAISIMGLVAALRFVEGIYRGSLFGLQRQVWYNGMNSVLATLRHGGAVFVLAWLSPTIQAFFYWQAAVSLLSVAVFSAGVHRALPVPPVPARFTFEAIADIWRFASGMMAITFLAILLTQVDKVLLSRLLSLESFGYYTLAVTVAGVLYLATGPITAALYPRLVELAALENEGPLASTYHQGAQLITVLMAPVMALLCVFPESVVFVWSGDTGLAESTAPILSVFVLGVFLNGLVHMPAQLQLAYGWVSLGIRTNIVAVMVLIPAILWVVPRYGAIGAAWIWVALNTGYVLITIQFMHRRLLLREKLEWYVADVLIPAIGAIGIMLLARWFQPIIYQDRWDWFFFLCLVTSFALAVSLVLAGRIRSTLLSLLRRWLQCAY